MIRFRVRCIGETGWLILQHSRQGIIEQLEIRSVKIIESRKVLFVESMVVEPHIISIRSYFFSRPGNTKIEFFEQVVHVILESLHLADEIIVDRAWAAEIKNSHFRSYQLIRFFR